MAGTSASSPFIKDEPEDHFFSPHNSRFMGGNQQGFQQFNQFGSHSGSINPNDLTMGGSNGIAIPNSQYGSSFQNNFGSQAAQNTGAGFAKFNDDELLDITSPITDSRSNQSGMHGNGQDYNVDNFDSFPNMYQGHNGSAALSVNPNMNGYSNTPEGDPIQSPFVQHTFNNAQYMHQIQQGQNFNNPMSSPGGYGSPLAGSDMQNGAVDPRRPQMRGMRRTSSTKGVVGKAAAMSLNENASYPTPIRTHRHQKSLSSQWDQTPSSLTSFPGSDFGSPISGVHPNPQISDILKGASMPTKLGNTHSAGSSAPALQSQEMKRRRRRESHNLVERRRRDNINERIQELSHLVPHHRLEDEKVRKALQNNSPLSPTLAGLSHPPSGMSPPQATSGLAGPGARRATAGNITTGIPIEEKDKGPNKGDILNGAVSWTRDLMWMLHVKMQQLDELNNCIQELGGTPPFQETEDELRMRTELMDAMVKNDGSKFHYSRAPGTGLRVPKHTDVKGDPVGSPTSGPNDTSLSPENHSSTGDVGQAGIGGAGQYWSGHNSSGSGPGSISFKEEDEYGMDLTQ
ncbi:hypothetical protein HYALB_00002839 [Hymenoscyphus albidus]|uniref:BHLH domain-containing protein n=1 Tax=Hymenoscyphus albidus TaxID=595503 RepID=A0A9N9Q380_9HELO|nr:hypothetical protein HYALB_00002839 [Hymenoscyphus albidus]